MARRHRKSYRGLVRFPGLGRLSLPSSVKPVDVVVGVAAGIAGSVGIKMAAEKVAAAPDFLKSGSPLIGGAITGTALYLAQKKSSPGRAAGHALGSLLGGLAVWGYGMVAGMTGGPVTLATTSTPAMQGWGFAPRTMPAGMGAPLFNNPRMQGPIFNNPNTQLHGYNFAALARMQGMGDENEDGNFPAP